MKLPIDEARAFVEVGVGNKWSGYTVVSDERVESRRWVEVRQIVISDDNRSGALYSADYEVGLTENQCVDDPFGYGVKEVEFAPTRAVPVTTVRYEVIR